MNLLCRIADISRKSYYAFLKRPELAEDDAEILGNIVVIQDEHRNGVGYREMTRLVRKRIGRPVNTKHVRRLMKENGLLSSVRTRKFSDEVYARRRELKGRVPPDLIRRWFFSLEPRKRLVEDITYIQGEERVEYLNTISDLFNGEILAWSISTSPDSALCIETIENLCQTWGDCFQGTIIHSDLGSSYMSYEYMEALESHGMVMSVGKKGSCYDNAAMESLNGIIKTEALYCRFGKTKVRERRVPIDKLKEAVVKFIEYYNNERPKKRLGWLSPVEFRIRNPKGTYLVPV